MVAGAGTGQSFPSRRRRRRWDEKRKCETFYTLCAFNMDEDEAMDGVYEEEIPENGWQAWPDIFTYIHIYLYLHHGKLQKLFYAIS